MSTTAPVCEKRMNVVICDDRARLPAKSGPLDVGYGLVCISKVQRDAVWDKKYLVYRGYTMPSAAFPIPYQNQFPVRVPGTDMPVAVYDTGIKVQPPAGYYVEIIPLPCMGKHGVVMLGSVGVVDPGYRGTLKVCLAGKPPPCPFKLCQLVLRRVQPDVEVKKVESL